VAENKGIDENTKLFLWLTQEYDVIAQYGNVVSGSISIL
jgi:hypothetical protein